MMGLYDMFGEEEERRRRMRPAAPSCYGCEYVVASPTLDCTHPNNIAVRWDSFRNKTYRIPSVSMCIESGGMCNHYRPSKECGAEYEIEQAFDKLSSMREMDRMVSDLIDTGKVDEFLKKLNQQLLEGDEEDE